MNYSHDYPKLKKKKYTTIRRHKKADKGDIVTETYPSGWHEAKVLSVQRNTLDALPLRLLQEDTGLKTRQEIYALFNTFYETPIDIYKDKMYIYYLERIE